MIPPKHSKEGNYMGENIVGQITAKYDPKKPGDNYTIYLSGKDGNDYRVYLPKCEYGKEDIVQIMAATAKTSSKGSVYYQANNISLVNDEPPTNGHTEPTREPISTGLSKGEEMLITGIWTRGVTSNKSPDELKNYADKALQYIRSQIGGKDEYNGQF